MILQFEAYLSDQLCNGKTRIFFKKLESLLKGKLIVAFEDFNSN